MPKTLSVIVPIYNEEACMKKIIPDMLDYCREHNWKLILVNDGSTDHTKELLQAYANDDTVQLIHHKLNRGYGAAVKSGIYASETDYCITVDADGQHVMEDVDKLFHRTLETDADMIVGSRKGLKSANLSRRIGKGLIRLLHECLCLCQFMTSIPVCVSSIPNSDRKWHTFVQTACRSVILSLLYS